MKWAKTKLIEIGKFEATKDLGQYDIGQFFIHRMFGYRGVVLFRWLANVYDRDTTNLTTTVDDKTSGEDFIMEQIKRLQSEKRQYYQVLIDHRDFPYIRTQPEAITFLGGADGTAVYSIPGLDYVNHNDLLPYKNTSPDPFQHELFKQFFSPSSDMNSGGYSPRDVLYNWRSQNQHWLALTDVHIETTSGIRVTVMPFFMGTREVEHSKVHWWRYSIRLENFSNEHVQLRKRHWRIHGSTGILETVEGKGVIGQEPVLSPQAPAFQYSSHVSLQSPDGCMWGTFRMEKQDGKQFDVRVPPFALRRRESSD